MNPRSMMRLWGKAFSQGLDLADVLGADTAKIILGSSTKYLQFDGANGTWKATVPLGWDVAGGSAGANVALLLGGGTSAAPISTSIANKNFIGFYAKTTAVAADSDSRLMYLRMYFSGATTGGGDCLRVFSTVEAACGTVRGAHVSLNWGASGTVSGLGSALTATLHLPNTGTLTGTLCAANVEVSCDDGASDNVVVPASHGLIRLSVGGDSGNVAKVLNAFHVDVPAGCIGNKAAALLISNADVTNTGAFASAGAIAINVNGTRRWIPFYAI